MPSPAPGHFPTTQWTLVARIKSADPTVAARALDELCAQYHYPLYCYLRRRGCGHHDSQDVLHDFLARLLRQRALERMEEARGRLRGYLSLSLPECAQQWIHQLRLPLRARRGRGDRRPLHPRDGGRDQVMCMPPCLRPCPALRCAPDDLRTAPRRVEGVARSHTARTLPRERKDFRAIPSHGRQP